ncbi:MAG: thioredoxin domain-containing protein [Candidatus Schekmanbacteria bacterium]|nr:thioredoxin domain-containing protein [Candidatus Schekmanbacteria bacterium]
MFTDPSRFPSRPVPSRRGSPRAVSLALLAATATLALVMTAACGGEAQQGSAGGQASGASAAAETTTGTASVGALAGAASAATAVAPVASGAAVTIEAYLDPSDPAGKMYLAETMPKIAQRYSGQVATNVHALPRPQLQESIQIAEALFCAGEQGKYDSFLDKIIASQELPSEEWVKKTGTAAGVDPAALQECIGKGTGRELVKKAFAAAQEARIRALPTFIVAGERIESMWATEVALNTLDRLLGRESEIEPIKLTVVYDPACQSCKDEDFLAEIQRNVYPKLDAKRLASDSMEGASLLKQAGITALPAFLFDPAIESVSSFAGIRPMFEKRPQGLYITPAQYPGPITLAATPSIELAVNRGSAEAPVVVTEFSDFLCPHCKHFAETIAPGLMEKFVDTGKVRFQFFPFPLGDNRVVYSQAALCVGKLKSDAFWGYHDALFANQERLDRNVAIELAEKAGLARPAFEQCLEDKGLTEQIKTTKNKIADEQFVTSTPTLYVNRLRVKGIHSVDELARYIDEQAPRGGK